MQSDNIVKRYATPPLSGAAYWKRPLYFVFRPKGIIVLLLLLFAACGGKHIPTPSVENRKKTDSLLMANRSIDSLQVWMERFAQQKNTYGEIAACRELGKRLRENSRFTEAIEVHKKGWQLAAQAHDTLQTIQAINNIATNFRRMGVLDEASSYHYQALAYCEAYSDKTDRSIQKASVVSLNGIGNIYLTLKNNEAAYNIFRRALEGERQLGSSLGQAINYANIGALFESDGKIDSARHYYRLSMQFNREAKSRLGISLCHTHFGRLYEKEQRLDSAIREYQHAYDLMLQSDDTWHWLESCLALARTHLDNGNAAAARSYLKKARQTAEKIHSPEHLAEVYHQEYRWQHLIGNDKAALEYFIKSRAYADSVTSEQSVAQVQNTRIHYERGRRQEEINLMEHNFLNEKSMKQITQIVSAIILLLACVIIAFLWYFLRQRAYKQKMMRQLEQMRTNFFTNITHEFRTPLTIIQSAAQDVLRRLPEQSDFRRNMTDILHYEHHLLNLINQILDIAKMSSSQIALPDRKHGNIVDFISMICDGYTLYATEKHITLVYTPLQEVIEMDFIPDYIQKIMQNLITNALKFSKPDSEVRIILQAKDRSLLINVSDTGIGMTPEQKANIFKPFYQASNDGGNIGTGIGLSLVKLVVEALHGDIEVQTAPDEGSTFTVTLPLCHEKNVQPFNMTEYLNGITITPSEESSEGEVLTDDDSSDENATRILIVEDTHEVARYMVHQLNSDYRFYFATDGNEGLQKAEQLVPDLIITDIMMPGMDGFELCRCVRASELLNHIPVIMVTAKATHEDRIHGLEIGADAYLEKPFHADELNVRVEKLLEQRRLLREKFALTSSTLPEAEPKPETAQEPEPTEATMPEANRLFVEKFMDAVQGAITQGKIDYDALAYSLCLSRAQLNRKLKAITGYTTTEYILQIRIVLAKRLLDETDSPVWEIALKCGIDNTPYFNILFKKSTGMTPLQYKNRNRS